jgi:choline-glycine betaine transporter
LFQQTNGIADLVSAVGADVATGMFAMLSSIPFATVLSIVAIALITIFFVSSSDSGSLVVDHLTSGGKLDSPTTQRVFWAIMEGVVAAVLLVGGGLETLQTASVATGLPFAVVLLIGVYTLYVGLHQEFFVESAVERAVYDAEEEHRLHQAVTSVVSDQNV